VNSTLGVLSKETLARFGEVAKQDGHDHLDRYMRAQGEFFGPVRLEGRSVLEIGSGTGLTSMFIALAGARSVVSMEPGLAGARSRVRDIQEERIAALGLRQIELLGEDFNTWNSGGRRFDVIVSQSSINHLQESKEHALRDRETYDRFVVAVRKIHDLLEPGGVACVSDACRYGLFAFAKRIGIRRPWGKPVTINWRIHQNPGTWRRIFTDAGFTRFEVAYPVPHRLRPLGPVVANPLGNFFLSAHFILRAWRQR